MKTFNRDRIRAVVGLAVSLVLVCLLTGRYAAAQVPSIEWEVLADWPSPLSDRNIGEDLIVVTNGAAQPDTRYGLADPDGTAVIPAEQRFLTVGDEIAAADESGRFRYFDRAGKPILTEAAGKPITMGDLFRDGYACVGLEGSSGRYVIDHSGKILLTPTEKQYAYVNLGHGLFARYPTGTADEAQAVVDSSGAVVYAGAAEFAGLDHARGFYCAETGAGSLWGIWDTASERKVTPPRYAFPVDIADSAALVEYSDGTAAVIDMDGNELLNLTQRYPALAGAFLQGGTVLLNFDDGASAVQIDLSGRVIAEYPYEVCSGFDADGVACVKKDGKYGFILADGTVLVPPAYDAVQGPVSGGWRYVSKGGTVSRFRLKQ